MRIDVEHVLGKVTGDHPDPGGPDVLLDIFVERRWLCEGRTIEVDVPRHLICAACAGGGCNVCGQSGAITMRERAEPPEVLRVTLPRHDFESDSVPESQRSISLRIQGRGGLPASGVWPSQRGRLLLRIRISGTVSDCVREIADDQVMSSSTLSKVDVVAVEDNPTSSVSPVTSMAASKRATRPAVDCDDSGSKDLPAPVMRRSLTPRAQLDLSVRVDADKAAPNSASPKSGARLWGRINWTDVVVGVLVLLLGAAAAWFLV